MRDTSRIREDTLDYIADLTTQLASLAAKIEATELRVMLHLAATDAKARLKVIRETSQRSAA